MKKRTAARATRYTLQLSFVVWTTAVLLAVLPSFTIASDLPTATSSEPAYLLVVRSGETADLSVLWRNVGGGRLPVHHVTVHPQLTVDEREWIDDTVALPKLDDITVALDEERMLALRKLVPRSEDEVENSTWPVVAAIRIRTQPDAEAGARQLFLHYVAGTGRGIYRRAIIEVVIVKEPEY